MKFFLNLVIMMILIPSYALDQSVFMPLVKGYRYRDLFGKILTVAVFVVYLPFQYFVILPLTMIVEHE